MINAKPTTWMPLYVGDYLRDTGHLTVIEHGAYLLLIMHAWSRGGALPVDESRLRGIAKMTPTQWRKSRKTLLDFFKREAEKYSHHRIDKELSTTADLIEKRSKAGRTGGLASSNRRVLLEANTQANQQQVASVLLEQSSTPVHTQTPITSSLRSDGAQVDLLGPVPVPPEDERKTRRLHLWREAKRVLGELGFRSDPAPFIGKLLKLAKDSELVVLAALAAAEQEKPADPGPWLIASVNRRAEPEADDPYGILAWIAKQPDVVRERIDGDRFGPCINDFPAEDMAMEIVTAADLPARRWNWDPFGVWLREGVIRTDAPIEAIRAQARRMRGAGDEVRSLAVFDQAVRDATERDYRLGRLTRAAGD